jgi:hypothetical protein
LVLLFFGAPFIDAQTKRKDLKIISVGHETPRRMKEDNSLDNIFFFGWRDWLMATNTVNQNRKLYIPGRKGSDDVLDARRRCARSEVSYSFTIPFSLHCNSKDYHRQSFIMTRLFSAGMWLLTARMTAGFSPAAKTFGRRSMLTALSASDNDFDDYSSKVCGKRAD